jgi:4-methylaminobutanoate oxidase (formaldehyde-forming)
MQVGESDDFKSWQVQQEGVGAGLGLVHAGLKALSSLRLEKAYRDYGHDMDNTDSLLQMGLGFTCDFDKAGGFLGKEAVQAEKAKAKIPHKRLLQVRSE